MTEQFRWRFNPNVIAQYVLDRHVPVGATTVLKPNEACLVIEDGRIIGTSTQTDLVVNPEVGALGRIFGKGPAKRAFLFVLLGPHDLHFTIKGRTKDGMEVRALVGLRVEFTIQQLGRLLNLPAKGTTTLLTGALAERLQPQMTPIVVNEVMARSTLDELRSDATAASNARASIRASMRSSWRPSPCNSTTSGSPGTRPSRNACSRCRRTSIRSRAAMPSWTPRRRRRWRR